MKPAGSVAAGGDANQAGSAGSLAADRDSGKAGQRKKGHRSPGRKTGKTTASKIVPSESTKKSDASVDALLRGLR
jgi:hypothetical protein